MKDLLTHEGYDVNSPRSTIRQLFASGFIADAEAWLVMLESRNRLSRIYDVVAAHEAQRVIKEDYAPLIGALIEVLRARRRSA